MKRALDKLILLPVAFGFQAFGGFGGGEHTPFVPFATFLRIETLLPSMTEVLQQTTGFRRGFYTLGI